MRGLRSFLQLEDKANGNLSTIAIAWHHSAIEVLLALNKPSKRFFSVMQRVDLFICVWSNVNQKAFAEETRHLILFRSLRWSLAALYHILITCWTIPRSTRRNVLPTLTDQSFAFSRDVLFFNEQQLSDRQQAGWEKIGYEYLVHLLFRKKQIKTPHLLIILLFFACVLCHNEDSDVDNNW